MPTWRNSSGAPRPREVTYGVEAQERFAQLNIETQATTPEQFRDFVQGQMALWSKVVKDANIRLG